MATGSFTWALGREAELHWRVVNNDPANCALKLVVLAAPVEADVILAAYTDLASILVNNPEVTNTGYSRTTITDATLAAFVVDTADRSITLPLANQTSAAISAGDSWGKLLIVYDDNTAGGTDADILPVKYYDVLNPSTNQAWVPAANTITFSFPDGYHIAR